MKPFIEQRADPYIIRKEGWYYFTASAPEFDRIILRKARTLEELPDAVEKIIWTRHEEGPMSCNIWAPELHFVDGKWYVYFAAARRGADESGVYDHRIYALENDQADPFSGGFTEKGRIDTGWESFSLDSTTVSYGGKRYFIWAQRDYEIPGNSNLYIARMKSALELALPGTRLSIPEYDWECRGFKALQVGVSIRYLDFSNRSHQCRLEYPIDTTREVYDQARRLLRELWRDRRPLRLMSISLGNLTREAVGEQLSLFEQESPVKREKDEKLEKAIDALRHKYGSDSIQRGTVMNSGIRVAGKFKGKQEAEKEI